MGELAIATENLRKSYSGFRAVRGMNLNVPQGAIYGFLGRNGAGKTTTIKMLLGLVRPTSGAATILGMDAERNHADILRRTAFVSERKTLYPSFTAAELVRFSRAFYPTWLDAAVEKYSRLLEIPMNRPFAKLSNGNQTKVWLLLALCQGADLIILDEPTAALDPLSVDQTLRSLMEIAADRGCTLFFSSHQLEEVEKIAEYVGMIEGGRLLVESRLDDIKSEFRLITATGQCLPTQTSSQILSVDVEKDSYRYVIAKEAAGFAAEIVANGAIVTNVSPLNLRDIFLHLVRKESACTYGNAGVIPVASF